MSVVVIADIKNKTINPATLEIINIAKKIAEVRNLNIYVFVPFVNVCSDSNCVNEFEIVMANLNIEQYNAPTLVKHISQALKNLDVQFILGLHTPFTIDYLPLLSVGLQAQCFTQIHSINFNDSITVTRGSYGGKLDQHIIIEKTPVILSILPGSFEAYKITGTDKKEIITIDIPQDDKFHNCNFITRDSKDTSLDEAEVIIGAGKGIGSEENLNVLYEFAKVFPHSAVAGSRIVCDNGWLPYSKQIGITGKSISSKVYIPCGISGSSQHVAGIKQVKTIIAINKDPYAPIFNVSHYGIVADLFEFIPQFIDFVKKR